MDDSELVAALEIVALVLIAVLATAPLWLVGWLWRTFVSNPE